MNVESTEEKKGNFPSDPTIDYTTTTGMRQSRLVRKENQRLLKQTGLLVGLTVLVLVLLFWLGVPALIRLAGFLGDLRSSDQPISQDDEIAPSPPQLLTLYEATPSASLDIRGFSEAKAKVLLFNNDSQVSENLAEEDGAFSFLDVALSEGDNVFYAIAEDGVGNKSVASPKVTVVMDNKAPELTVSEPTDGKTIYGPGPKQVKVSGVSEDGVSVWVNDRVAFVDSDGGFSLTVILNDGDNVLQIKARDRAGNETLVEVRVKYVL